MYSQRAVTIPPYRLGAIIRFEVFGVRVRLVSRGRMAAAATTVFDTAARQVLHVYAVGLVENDEVLALAVLGVVLVAVDRVVVESVVCAAFALAAAVEGRAREHC